jgi:hypothetical protein
MSGKHLARTGRSLGPQFISDQGVKGATFFNPTIHTGKRLSFEGEYARRFLITPVFSISGELLLMYNQDEEAMPVVHKSGDSSAIPRTVCDYGGASRTISDHGGFPMDQPRRRFRPHR